MMATSAAIGMVNMIMPFSIIIIFFVTDRIQNRTYGAHTGDLIQHKATLCNNRRIKMVLPERVEIRQVYEIAAAREIQIRRLDYKRDSLQEIFLKAMEGRSAADSAAGGA